MALIDSLLAALHERRIAQQVGLAHDEARLRFPLRGNTVRSFEEFCTVIAQYYNHHHSLAMGGGNFSGTEARGRAKAILETEYRRRRSEFNSAVNDALDGTNGGMRGILDTIADALKTESVELYIRDMFDQHVVPLDWHTKVEIIRQFIDRCGGFLAPSIDSRTPERYAQNYRELIQSYVDGLKQTSSVFRRI